MICGTSLRFPLSKTINPLEKFSTLIEVPQDHNDLPSIQKRFLLRFVLECIKNLKYAES